MNNDSAKEADAIRSEIDQTRQRMDETMDALGNRMKPRHLVDDLLGAFRGSDGEGRLHAMRERVTHGASTAMHSVADTVKANPIPILLIGAGVAWMIYESRREKGTPDWGSQAGTPEYDPDLHYDRPMEYPSTVGQMEMSATGEAGGMEEGSKLGAMGHGIAEKAGHAKDALKEKASSAGHTIKEKASSAGQAVREKVSGATGRARQALQSVGTGVKHRAGEAYSATRQRVVTTADHHPLEVGLLCLAAGLIAGLALPTSERVNRAIGPRADRLRERAKETGREMVEKGRRVARAATDAAKQEIESQGLTPDRLREAGQAVAQSAKHAASDTARQEGMPMAGGSTGGERREGEAGPMSGSSDPSATRPVV